MSGDNGREPGLLAMYDSQVQHLQARLAKAEDRLGLVVEERNQALQECDFALEGLQELQRQLAAERLAHGRTRQQVREYVQRENFYPNILGNWLCDTCGVIAPTEAEIANVEHKPTCLWSLVRNDAPDPTDLWQRAEKIAAALKVTRDRLKEYADDDVQADALHDGGIYNRPHEEIKPVVDQADSALAAWWEASPRDAGGAQ